MGILANMRASQARERQLILTEVMQIRGLMPRLMKSRNGQPWSIEDKTEILRHLHVVASFSPYLVPIVIPGGVFMLPILAWWLDRRRGERS
jgi:hypothetical protein